MWEDEHNNRGGRWLMNLDKRKRGPELDRYWQETVRNARQTICPILTMAAAFFEAFVALRWAIESVDCTEIRKRLFFLCSFCA